MSAAKETKRNAENGLVVMEGQETIAVSGYIKLGYDIDLSAKLIDAPRKDICIAIMQAITDGDYHEVEAVEYSVTGP